MQDLPYVDEHVLDVATARDAVWGGLLREQRRMLGAPAPAPFSWVLRPEPASGFGVAEQRDGELLSLRGRHRFSRYRLDFALADADGGGTRIAARTWAEFPGLKGRAYRALVIGTGAHKVVTRGLLRRVARSARR